MVKLNNAFNQQAQAGFAPNSQSTQASFNEQSVQPQASQPKGLISLPPALMQIVPWIPFAFEALSGQKIPAMGGTIGEMHSSLQQIQFNLSQVLTQQQQLWTKLENLENNASQQLTHLATSVQSLQSLRLTHSKEQKAIEYNAPHRLPEEEYP